MMRKEEKGRKDENVRNSIKKTGMEGIKEEQIDYVGFKQKMQEGAYSMSL